jgi:hypothetical protein
MRFSGEAAPIRENSCDLTRSIPLVSPFGPTSGRSISRLPPRSIVDEEPQISSTITLPSMIFNRMKENVA